MQLELSLIGALAKVGSDQPEFKITATVQINAAGSFRSNLISRLSSNTDFSKVETVIKIINESINRALKDDERLSLLWHKDDDDESEEEWPDETLEIYGEGYIHGRSPDQFIIHTKNRNVIRESNEMSETIKSITEIDIIDYLAEIRAEDHFHLFLVGNPECDNTWWELADEVGNELPINSELGLELTKQILSFIDQ